MSRRVSLPFLLEDWAEPIPDVRVAGLCSGSNRIAPGDAYVHLGSGGRQALRRARERGALAIIHDETLKVELPGVPAIGIADLAGRLPALAARFHHHPADALRIAAVATDGGPASPAWFIAQSWQRARGGAALVAPAGTGRFDALQPGPEAKAPDPRGQEVGDAVAYDVGVAVGVASVDGERNGVPLEIHGVGDRAIDELVDSEEGLTGW